MKRVYIAGPFTAKGDKGSAAIEIFRNMRRGIRKATLCLLHGYAPFVPWFDAGFFFQLKEDEYINRETILAYSITWLEVCDAVLVLPGYEESQGTLAEIARAKELNIPVFFSMRELRRVM